MSATADKARYFLEQSVPELKEFERKKIFSSEEIRSIAKKRSDFEHKINARGCSASDYAHYAEFEMNVEALRKRRVKRLGAKSTAYNGQRRVYFVFDRGTRKFAGDVRLWMQYIEYARKQKAYKKLTQIFTNVLRLHPAKSELWIYAAQFAMEENGDMTEARSYMQRGLRFCKNCRNMWLEYARLELSHMAKILVRRQVLGLEDGANKDSAEQDSDDNENLLKLPTLTAEDLDPETGKVSDIDPITLHDLEKTPVMSGAIPLAIFDAAMTRFQFDGSLGIGFFDMIAGFAQLPVALKMLDHVLGSLSTGAPDSWQTYACQVQRPLVGVPHDSPDYPAALRQTLRDIRQAMSETERNVELVTWCKDWLHRQLDEAMDAALQRVIQVQIQSLSAE